MSFQATQKHHMRRKLLSEGKHWPEDYVKTAVNAVKASQLKKDNPEYNDVLIRKDIESILKAFKPLSHKNSNLGFFMTVVRWLLEYSGGSMMKQCEFLEYQLDAVISGLLKIRADKSYDSQAEKIKKMPFKQFMDLVDKASSSSSRLDTKQNDAQYEVIPIYSYEELNKKYGGSLTGYNGKSEWCHTNGKSTYDSWTEHGTKMFFVIQRKDWRSIKAPCQLPENAYDEYGMSLIAVLVGVMANKLLNSTSRWNHVVLPKSGYADIMFETWDQLNNAVGMDVESICKQECAEAKEQHAAKSKTANQKAAQAMAGKTVVDQYAFKNLHDSGIAAYVTDISVPDGVTFIDHDAFYGFSQLKSVVVPRSVKEIGSDAFANCESLTSIVVPDGVQCIGSYAFENTALVSFTMPGSVEDVESRTFSGCCDLTSAVLLDGISMIEHSAFAGCRSLRDIQLPGSLVGIGRYAFQDCQELTHVSIPDGARFIELKAFENCKRLKTVVIPASIRHIDHYAFGKCQALQEVLFKDMTREEVQDMDCYPWGIEDTSVIKAGKTSSTGEIALKERHTMKTNPKKYTKKQILESIKHWKTQLKLGNYISEARTSLEDKRSFTQCMLKHNDEINDFVEQSPKPTKDELIEFISAIFKEENLDTPWTREFLLKMKHYTRSYDDAVSYLYNARLKGQGLGVREDEQLDESGEADVDDVLCTLDTLEFQIEDLYASGEYDYIDFTAVRDAIKTIQNELN